MDPTSSNTRPPVEATTTTTKGIRVLEKAPSFLDRIVCLFTNIFKPKHETLISFMGKTEKGIDTIHWTRLENVREKLREHGVVTPSLLSVAQISFLLSKIEAGAENQEIVSIYRRQEGNKTGPIQEFKHTNCKNVDVSEKELSELLDLLNRHKSKTEDMTIRFRRTADEDHPGQYKLQIGQGKWQADHFETPLVTLQKSNKEDKRYFTLNRPSFNNLFLNSSLVKNEAPFTAKFDEKEKKLLLQIVQKKEKLNTTVLQYIDTSSAFKPSDSAQSAQEGQAGGF